MKSPSLLYAAFSLIIVDPAVAVESGDFTVPVEKHVFHPKSPTAEQPKIRLQRVVSGLDQPLFVTTKPGERDLFVVEKSGRIRLIRNGELQADAFLDLSERVDNVGECGLLGLAFDPQFSRSGRAFVAYTDRATFSTIISRFEVFSDNRDRLDPASEVRLLTIPQNRELVDHKAGWLGFRPGEDDNLYVTTGDGGGRNDPANNSQNLLSLSGKILRIKVSGEEKYEIPTDNPFRHRDDALPEIWAYGLRNPYRASFDRQTGELFIGDVGQDSREEINYESAYSKGGRNYGWRIKEGNASGAAEHPDEHFEITDPILEYPHRAMLTHRGCVIGGYVYRGRLLPELAGTYFFADFTNARIYSFRQEQERVADLTDWSEVLDPSGERVFFSSLSSFGEDGDGELYLVDFAGALYRIAPDEIPG